MTQRPTSPTNLKEDERLILAVRALLASSEGRYFFRCYLGACGIRRTSFTGNALSGAFAQGLQNAGLILEDLLSTAAPELFLQLLKEHYEDENIS